MSSITDLLTGGQYTSNPEFKHVGDFVQGVVTDNNNKEFAGMVKVEFTSWKKDNNIGDWIPVLQQYAGKEYGTYLLPEIGDIVIVGFMGTDKKRPFILGSLYPANATMLKNSFIDKNTNKLLTTKGKVELSISDEDQKQSVKVMTPKGLSITIADENDLITISDKEAKNVINIDAKGGEMSITADKKITIKAGKCQIVMDGSSGKLDISCDQLNISASKQATVSGGQKMAIDGGMLSLNGKQTAELKGGTMTTISGGMVKIN